MFITQHESSNRRTQRPAKIAGDTTLSTVRTLTCSRLWWQGGLVTALE